MDGFVEGRDDDRRAENCEAEGIQERCAQLDTFVDFARCELAT
jgi:hypothetical protein